GGGWQQHASGGPEAAWHDGSFLDDHVAQVRPLADARAIEQHAPVDRGRTGDLDSLTGDDAGAGERQTGVEILARRADVEERRVRPERAHRPGPRGDQIVVDAADAAGGHTVLEAGEGVALRELDPDEVPGPCGG